MPGNDGGRQGVFKNICGICAEAFSKDRFPERKEGNRLAKEQPKKSSAESKARKKSFSPKKKIARGDEAALTAVIQELIGSTPAPKKTQKKGKKTEAKKAESKAAASKKNQKKNKPAAESIPAPIVLPEEKVVEKPAEAPKASKKQSAPKGPKERPAPKKEAPVKPLKLIPLGGLHEIGKNITAYEYDNEIFIIDCGMTFPDADMLGVDIVIPDFTYLEKNAHKLKAIVITHGHEDHIGGLPYLLKKVNVPVYGSRLTLGLIEGKLKEHGLLRTTELRPVAAGDKIDLGSMQVEFIRVNHSIPDALACAVYTPAGIIVQTGDFKVDYTPIQGEPIDLARFAELGREGVLCLLSDSTNASKPGFTPSERKVGASFENLFQQAGDRRIIVAAFSSNVHRIQQVADNAYRTGRKVAVSGRSMLTLVNKAIELGYLNVPEGLIIDVDQIGRYRNDQLVLVTTGSQGEPMSALSRMAAGDHRKISVTSDDFIIISAYPIPGNEKHVTRVINDLMKLGAEVIYQSMYEIHVSGHACQSELELMLSLTKPKYFMPVHGEYLHLKEHADLARKLGIPDENIIISEIGQVIEFKNEQMKFAGSVEAGRVFVDGYGVGDVGSIVLRDRTHLAQDGLIIVVMTIDSHTGNVVAGPEIVSRGFVYVRESEELMDGMREQVDQVIAECQSRRIREWGAMKGQIKDRLSSYIYKKTKRDPMILPIIMEI